jgi:hypothetical protein
MVSITAMSILSTLFISHVLKLLESKNKKLSFLYLDTFVSDLILYILIIFLSFFTSHSYSEAIIVAIVVGISTFGSQTPSRIVTIIALLTHFADVLHELLFKFLGKNKEHDKNWEKIQRNEVRELFLYYLQLKRSEILSTIS